jgi:hypothetical protein
MTTPATDLRSARETEMLASAPVRWLGRRALDEQTDVFPLHVPDAPAMDVVLLHGLDGHARKMWAFDEQRYWPNWLAEDITGVAVWTADYAAASSRWWGHAMTLEARARNLMAQLQNRGIGERPLAVL